MRWIHIHTYALHMCANPPQRFFARPAALLRSGQNLWSQDVSNDKPTVVPQLAQILSPKNIV
jgi:hypothetical protein